MSGVAEASHEPWICAVCMLYLILSRQSVDVHCSLTFHFSSILMEKEEREKPEGEGTSSISFSSSRIFVRSSRQEGKNPRAATLEPNQSPRLNQPEPNAQKRKEATHRERAF